ncbi:hypothetical protein AB835_09770 [Candidatus Endobugula sertula]|uniref:Uncharacterized protein n=1 Tax=Candidatus Endobugula sertula TaxID=62101 RepID=A0A1D2QNT3_9GAMM|nr:hypothetical protein AB835_09770 [Candidatus Endobugula sertula]
MNITAECQEKMIEYGVVTNDGIPAGYDLINSDKIKIALLDEDFTMNDLEKSIGKEVPYLYSTDELQSQFSELYDFEDIARRALSYWYKGEIEFVDTDDSPNMYVFAYKGGIVSGVATVPENDHVNLDTFGYPVSIIGLNMQTELDDDVLPETELFDILRHEFDHSFGVLHPESSVNGMRRDGVESCETSEAGIDTISSYGSKAAIMAMGETIEESFFDQGTKQYVHTGIMDNAPKL